MKAVIRAIEICFPETILTNEELAKGNAGWTARKILEKTGIKERRIAAVDECASDIGVAAANRLFESGACKKSSIDYLLFCTQSSDFFLPTTACLIHERLGLHSSCGALDFNLGCSGYVYGLSLAKALVESGQANNVLLITAETYSKYIHPEDRSVRTLFGDAGAATLVSGVHFDEDFIGPFIFGTDGRGGKHLIVPTGGMRRRPVPEAEVIRDGDRNCRTINNLFMDGPEIFNFTLRVVPETVNDLLLKTGKTKEQIDLFVFHQANAFMLEHLRKKLMIPEKKFVVALEHCGNTVSSTIPIALKDALSTGKLKSGQLLMLVGFGVGFSWGGVLVKWFS
jgi:3-oxoacyl-[acyl-carrier-protein] synthase-3